MPLPRTGGRGRGAAGSGELEAQRLWPRGEESAVRTLDIGTSSQHPFLGSAQQQQGLGFLHHSGAQAAEEEYQRAVQKTTTGPTYRGHHPPACGTGQPVSGRDTDRTTAPGSQEPRPRPLGPATGAASVRAPQPCPLPATHLRPQDRAGHNAKSFSCGVPVKKTDHKK